MRKKRELTTLNFLQSKEKKQKIKLLKKKHKALAEWIINNITHPDWEQKVRTYNALSSRILAMEGKTRYIIIHYQN